MNRKRWVWLPPDGDPRLVRFQQDLALEAELADHPALPVHLELVLPGREPRGPVRTAGWTRLGDESVLEARDDGGPVGVFRFGLDLGQLPLAPDWSWTKGRTGWLEFTWPHGDGSFVVWSWASVRGWRADRPRE